MPRTQGLPRQQSLQNVNADASLIEKAEAIANGVPVLETPSTGTASLLADTAEADAGLASAPVTPALALAQ